MPIRVTRWVQLLKKWFNFVNFYQNLVLSNQKYSCWIFRMLFWVILAHSVGCSSQNLSFQIVSFVNFQSSGFLWRSTHLGSRWTQWPNFGPWSSQPRSRVRAYLASHVTRAGSGSGFYYINPKPKPAWAWFLGWARCPDPKLANQARPAKAQARILQVRPGPTRDLAMVARWSIFMPKNPSLRIFCSA
jgi:hypothetical protein